MMHWNTAGVQESERAEAPCLPTTTLHMTDRNSREGDRGNMRTKEVAQLVHDTWLRLIKMQMSLALKSDTLHARPTQECVVHT